MHGEIKKIARKFYAEHTIHLSIKIEHDYSDGLSTIEMYFKTGAGEKVMVTRSEDMEHFGDDHIVMAAKRMAKEMAEVASLH